MSQPERTSVSRWTRLRSFVVGKYKAVQLSIERRSFERKLESIVRAALAHQSGGLPAGNRQYKLLTTAGGLNLCRVSPAVGTSIQSCSTHRSPQSGS